MTSRRRRLEDRLVVDGAAPGIEAARELVAAGAVLVDGAPARSPARPVSDATRVEVHRPRRFVGRGGEKLEGALSRLSLDPAGQLALDAGAATGGFTDCLLAHGAARVLAVDVGRHLLHERLMADARVVVLESTNVLDVTGPLVADLLGGRPGLVTADVSFTSATRIVPHLVGLCADGAHVVVLVKPQFEADHVVVSRGRGVVRDPVTWRAAVERCGTAVEAAGAGIMGVVASPLAGAAGNREFFVAAVVGASPADPAALGAWIDAAIAEAAP